MLSELRVLRLSDNWIEQVPNQLPAMLKNLEVLDLGQNEIASISGFFGVALAGRKLRQLMLDDNNLEQSLPVSIAMVDSLHVLDISRHRLIHILLLIRIPITVVILLLLILILIRILILIQELSERLPRADRLHAALPARAAHVQQPLRREPA